MAKYLKLGVKAKHGGSFTDSSTEINIAGEQVVKVHPKHLSESQVQERLQGGHIVEATEAEYNAYQAKVSKLNAKDESKKDDLKKLASSQADEDVDDTDDEDFDDKDEDDDDEDDEDSPARTKASMVNDLRASPAIDEKQKEKLDSMKVDKLMKLHDKVILGK